MSGISLASRRTGCASSLSAIEVEYEVDRWYLVFLNRFTGKVVIAVTAFILCQCLTIESSAQTASAAFRNMETEVRPGHPSQPEVIGRQAGLIDGGILNLDAAFIATLREAQMDEVRTSEPGLSAASAPPTNADSGEGEEKSRLKAPSDDPQDLESRFVSTAA